MWWSERPVLLPFYVGLSAVSGAVCLECQLVYSSNSLLPVVKLCCGGGTACAGILLQIYGRIWKGRVCACVCHKRGLSGVFFSFPFFLQLKEIDEVGVIR